MTVDEFIAMTGWNAPEPMARIGMNNALRWFEANFRPEELNKPEHLSQFAGPVKTQLVKWMQSIAFLAPVEADSVVFAGARLVRYCAPGREWGVYFTAPGTRPSQLAIPSGRVTRFTFRASRAFRCLKTSVADAHLSWSPNGADRYGHGGGVQYFVAKSKEKLELVDRSIR